MDLAQWISQNENLIYKIAGYFNDYGNIEDLYQAGCIGAIKASKNYDENRGTKFSSFAYPYILGEMKDLVRKNNPVKISKEIFSLNKKVAEAKSSLMQAFLREPTIEELSVYLEMDEADIEEILNYNFFVSSIDSTYGDTNMLMEEVISDENVDIDTLIMIKTMISNLEEPERSIMIKRYYEDMTQTEVANSLGLKQTFVSRHEAKVLKHLRKTI